MSIINILMSWYPVMNDSDGTDFYTLSDYAQRVSSGILFPFLLLTIFIISMIGMVSTGKSFSRSLTFSGFICSIFSILLVVMNWLNVQYMYLAFFITGVGLIGVRLSEAGN